MLYLFFANGFEETEAMAPLDVLRRAKVEVTTVGVGGTAITGSHNVTFMADITTDQVELGPDVDGIILPGGMPGTLNLEADATVQAAIDYCAANNKLLCAICAAPSILGHKQLLEGKPATCFPGFEDDLYGATPTGTSVVSHENIITCSGAGGALLFGKAIAARFVGEETAGKVLASMQYPHEF